MPEILISDKIKIEPSNFGNFAVLHHLLKTDAMVVCGWKALGPLKPIDVRLVGQLYESDIHKLLKTWEEIWVIPYDSKHLVATKIMR